MLENPITEQMRPYARCRWFCGFSGGTDSTALLLLLKAAAKTLGASLRAVHFEHGLRGEESLKDADFCRDFAQTHRIPLQVIALHVRENRRRGEGIEEAARRLRMREWERLAADPDAVVVLAHHADDAAENLLLRMARGSNLGGLLSPSFRTVIGGVTYLRPLLEQTKAELQAYLQERGVSRCCEDASNADCRFARNRIRNRVIPEWKKIHAGSTEGIRRSLQNLRCEEDFLERAAVAAFAPWAEQPTVPLAFWKTLHPALQGRCLKLFLTGEGLADVLLSGAFFRRFGRLLEKGRGRIPLNGTFLAAQGAMLSLERPCGEPRLWDWRREPEIRIGRWRFHAELRPVMPEKTQQTPEAFYFDADRLPAELILRARRSGDVLETFDHRHVPLKKLFTDAKLPAVRRSAPLVLESPAEGILGVLLLRRGAASPVTEKTKRILRISAE